MHIRIKVKMYVIYYKNDSHLYILSLLFIVITIYGYCIDKEAILESSKAATVQSKMKQSTDKTSISDVILPPPHSQSSSSSSGSSMTVEEQNELKERSKAAFYHAYDSYMNYAYPKVSYLPIIYNTYIYIFYNIFIYYTIFIHYLYLYHYTLLGGIETN